MTRRGARSGGAARTSAYALFGALCLAAFALPAPSAGQTLSIDRPHTIVVGTPRTGSRTDRLDAARTGRSATPLPAAHLRTEWRIPLGTLVEQAPLVDAHGNTYVVGSRGEVLAIARDGTERWRVATGAAQPGPPALLSDDTLVFVDALGQAVAVRDGAVAWRTRFGRPDGVRPSPLPLDDGGVVVATSHELAALDADGDERARATIAEPVSAPLIAGSAAVLAVDGQGAIWSWAFGGEPSRVGSFGSAIDGGAALADRHTLLAVTSGQLHLTSVDLDRGTVATRAVAAGGVWRGPPALHPGGAFVELLTATSELAIDIDPAGAERERALLAMHPPVLALDGGVAAAPGGPQAPPITDAAGVLAFATLDGGLGVAYAGRVERLGHEVCEPPIGVGARSAPAVAGLAPVEAGVMVAACRSGALLAVHGEPAASHR